MTALILIVAIILVIYTLAKLSQLSQKVEQLERDLHYLAEVKGKSHSINSSIPESSFPAPSLTTPPPAPSPQPVQPTHDPVPSLPPSKPNDLDPSPAPTKALSLPDQPTTDQWVDDFIHWFSIDWPMKIGALLVIAGFVWLIGYAYMQDWITDTMLIVAGIVIGIGVAAAGYWRSQHNQLQGQIIEVLGNLLILITVYAGYSYYQILPWWLGLTLAYLTIASLTWSSLRYQQRYIAYAGLLIGGLLPHLVGLSTDYIIAYVSVLSLLTVSFFVIAHRQAWYEIELISLGVVGIGLLPLISITNNPHAHPEQQFLATTALILTSVVIFAWYAYQTYKTATPNQTQLSGLIIAAIFSLGSILLLDLENVALHAPWLFIWAIAYLSHSYLLAHRHLSQNASAISWWTGALSFTLGLGLLEPEIISNLNKLIILIIIATVWPIINYFLSAQKVFYHSLLYYTLPIALSYLYFPQIDWDLQLWQPATYIISLSLLSQWSLTSFIYFIVNPSPQNTHQPSLSTISFTATIIYSLLTSVFIGLNPHASPVLQVMTIISLSTTILISHLLFKPTQALISLLTVPVTLLIGLQHASQLLSSETFWNIHLMISAAASLAIWTIAIFYNTSLLILSAQPQKRKLQHNLRAIFYFTSLLFSGYLIAAFGWGLDRPVEISCLSMGIIILTIWLSNQFWNPKFAQASLGLAAIPVLLTLPEWSGAPWIIGPWNKNFILLLTTNATLWIVSSLYFQRYQKVANSPDHFHVHSKSLLIISAVYSLLLFWRVTDAYFDSQTVARTITLTTYSLIGIASYIIGQANKMRITTRFGQTLILFVVGWLVIVEVWQLSLIGRIITFITIGTLLILSVLMPRKFLKKLLVVDSQE